MTDNYFTHTILLSCMLIVLCTPAAAEIVQCADENGAVTYTNLPCENSANLAAAAATNIPSPTKVKVASTAATFAAGWEAREGASVKYRASKPSVTLDQRTMAVAKTSTLAIDQATSFLHQQNLVALDLRHQRWFDFR